jgi:hypothetical protein
VTVQEERFDLCDASYCAVELDSGAKCQQPAARHRLAMLVSDKRPQSDSCANRLAPFSRESTLGLSLGPRRHAKLITTPKGSPRRQDAGGARRRNMWSQLMFRSDDQMRHRHLRPLSKRAPRGISPSFNGALPLSHRRQTPLTVRKGT